MKEVLYFLLVLLLAAGVSAQLSILQIDLKVENPGESLRRDTHIDEDSVSRIEMRPGAEVLLKVRVKNQGDKLINVRVNADVGPFDGSRPLQLSSESFDAEEDETHWAEIETLIPLLVREGIYLVEIEVVGEDEQGDEVIERQTFSIEIEKLEFSLDLRVSDVVPMDCGRAQVSWEVVNTGRKPLPKGMTIVQGSESQTLKSLESGSSIRSLERFSAILPLANEASVSIIADAGKIRESVSESLPKNSCAYSPLLQVSKSRERSIILPYTANPSTPKPKASPNGFLADILFVGLLEGFVIIALAFLMTSRKFLTKQ